MSARAKLKKVIRWLTYAILVIVLLLVVAFLSIDTVVRKVAEKRIQQETGFVAEIGKVRIGFRDQSLTVKDFKLLNPPEFGGGTFVSLPEFHVEYDLEAMRSNVVHLRFVKIDLAELNIVEHKDGKRNVDALIKSQSKQKKPGTHSTTSTTSTNAPALPFDFGGIDKMQLTLGETKYSSEKYPDRSFDRNMGIKDEVFKDIRNEQDLQTVGVVIALKAGVANLFQDKFF